MKDDMSQQFGDLGKPLTGTARDLYMFFRAHPSITEEAIDETITRYAKEAAPNLEVDEEILATNIRGAYEAMKSGTLQDTIVAQDGDFMALPYTEGQRLINEYNQMKNRSASKRSADTCNALIHEYLISQASIPYVYPLTIGVSNDPGKIDQSLKDRLSDPKYQ